MSNKEKGQVDFRVGAKRFTIKLGTNEAAEATPFMDGKNIFEVDIRNMNVLRALLFVMAKGQNGVDTIKDAGNLIDEDPVACAKAVDEAAALFFQRWTIKQEAAKDVA